MVRTLNIGRRVRGQKAIRSLERGKLEPAVLIPISKMVPNVDDLLDLTVEELAGVLLTHINSLRFGDNPSVFQFDSRINQYNFFHDVDHNPPYSSRKDEVSRALMEAWTWLQGEGLIVRDCSSSTSNSVFLSRVARRLRSRDDLDSYRKADLLPKGQLHPLIATKVYPAFLRGEYDTAVFQAFREVEVAVRTAGRFAADDVGVSLMQVAFRPSNPEKSMAVPEPLTDTNLPVAEQEGMMNLFAGAIGIYKNPQSHRAVPTEAVEAAEVIVFASHLLRIVERRAPSVEKGT